MFINPGTFSSSLDKYQRSALVLALHEMICATRSIDPPEMQEWLSENDEELLGDLLNAGEELGGEFLTAAEFNVQWVTAHSYDCLMIDLVSYTDDIVWMYELQWPLYAAERRRYAAHRLSIKL